jgi:3-(3-hydroxy-phenyl)propionate hydroxylase
MTEHAVVIVGGGPTGLMLAGELALARIDVAIVERRQNQDLPSSRAGGLHARTIEILDQRGVADRFLAQGKTGQVAGFSFIPLDLSDFPTRHNYVLALRQNQIGSNRLIARSSASTISPCRWRAASRTCRRATRRFSRYGAT